MARYIDVEPMPHGRFWDECTDMEKAKILGWILRQPTADVEEVVRCKNCFKAQEMSERWGEQYKYFCKRHHSYVLANDFCSYGE